MASWFLAGVCIWCSNAIFWIASDLIRNIIASAPSLHVIACVSFLLPFDSLSVSEIELLRRDAPRPALHRDSAVNTTTLSWFCARSFVLLHEITNSIFNCNGCRCCLRLASFLAFDVESYCTRVLLCLFLCDSYMFLHQFKKFDFSSVFLLDRCALRFEKFECC